VEEEEDGEGKEQQERRFEQPALRRARSAKKNRKDMRWTMVSS
jgi:uncharacterized protein YccT (UPF0319 family)